MKKSQDSPASKSPFFAEMRSEYRRSALKWENFPEDPLPICKQWIYEAVQQQLPEPNAMYLATSSVEGKPSLRTVLLKDIDEEGLTFYTSYESKKGKEIAANPQVALLFFWATLERQLRIQGSIERLPAEVSDAYFSTRPRSSQLSTWASKQSSVLPEKPLLLQRREEHALRFMKTEQVPRPPTWGGYLVRPESFEFWQGRSDRLHDRIAYQKQPQGQWKKHWLSP